MPAWKRASLGLLALLLGSCAGSQVFAFQVGYHPSLGSPLGHLGPHALYRPWDGWRWARQWAGQAPGRFQGAALTGLSVVALLMLPLAKKQAPHAAPGVRWATTRDLKAFRQHPTGGIILGRHRGHILRHHGPEHVLCVAPTQSGKSTALVIPTLLSWEASVLIHDPKDELYALTAGWRATGSRVIHWQPTASTSACYNPFDAIRLGTDREIRDAQIIAEMLVDPDSDGERGGASQHFRELVTALHTGLILHVLRTGQAACPGGLQALLAAREFTDLILEMKGNPHPAVQWAASTVDDLADRELSGVLSTARRALQLWVDPLIARTTGRSDFTLHDLREAEQPLSLYLSIPFADQARLRPLTRLLVRQMLDYCTQHKGGWRHRLLGMIDEVPALKHLNLLSEGLDYFAGYGLTLCLITPSLHTLEKLYGPRHNFIEGCRYRVVFAPNDDEVAAKFSRLAGMAEVEKQREMVAREPFQALRDRTTTSTETIQQPLLSSTALLNLPEDQLLLLIGNRAPVLLHKARYFQHPEWQRRSTIPPPRRATC